MYKTNNARLLVHLWAEIMHSVLDSPPGYTALGPADLGAVYPGALLAHRALFGPECTRTRALSVYYVLAIHLINSSFLLFIIYCIRYIFRESNFSRIGTSRHFREWLNSRSRSTNIAYTSRIHASGSEVNIFACC